MANNRLPSISGWYTKMIKFLVEVNIRGEREGLKIQEIEEAASRFKVCPKCKSVSGFWLGFKRDNAYVQCKGCGAKFELHEVYAISEKGEAPRKSRFFRK